MLLSLNNFDVTTLGTLVREKETIINVNSPQCRGLVGGGGVHAPSLPSHGRNAMLGAVMLSKSNDGCMI